MKKSVYKSKSISNEFRMRGLVCLLVCFATLLMLSYLTVTISLRQQAADRYDRQAIQKAKVQKLYDNVVYPISSNMAYQIENGNYSVVEDLFVQNVKGRINPLGRFDNFVSTGEYFYALAGPLPGVPTAGKVRAVSIEFTGPIICWENSCHYRVIISVLDFDTNSVWSNFTHIGLANFNSENQICSYEANFVGMSRRDLPEDEAVRSKHITKLCAGIQALCVGGNQQYADQEECAKFMHSIPYGGNGQSDQNTRSCRVIHLALAKANPKTHCPHVGPTGGGKCIYHSEESYLDNLDECRDKNW